MNTATAKTETAPRVLPDLTAQPEAKPAEPAQTPAPKKTGKPTGKKVAKVREKGRQTVKAKAAPAKAAPAKPAKAKKLPFPENAKIKLLVESNPKRPGSKGAARFDLYKNGMTVAEAVKAGVTPKDLVWDADHKFVQIK